MLGHADEGSGFVPLSILITIGATYLVACLWAGIYICRSASYRVPKSVLGVSVFSFCLAASGYPLLFWDMCVLKASSGDHLFTAQRNLMYTLWIGYFVANFSMSW